MMEIKRIYLENFLSHEKSDIKFKPGINVIIGHNGAGKSSIIDAIYFSLFRDPVRKINQDDLIRKGSKEAKVELDVEINGKTYQITRLIKGSITDTISEIFPNGYKTLARGAKEVDATVYKLINADEEIFSSTLFIAQGKIEEIFDNISKIMDKILRIERMNELRETNGPIHQLIKEVDNELKYLEGEKERYKIIEQRINDNKKRIEEDQKQLQEITERVKRIQEDIQKKKTEITQLEDKKAKVEALFQNKLSIQKEIQEIEEKLRQLPGLLGEKENLETKVKDEELLNNKLNAIKEAKVLISSIKQTSQFLDNLIKQLNSKKSDLEEKKMLEDKERIYQELNRKKMELENVENEYTRLISILENIKRNVEEKKKRLSEMKIINEEELKTKLESLNEELERKRKEKEEITSRKSEVEGEIKQLVSIKNNLHSLESVSKCPVCGRDLSEHERSKIYQELSEKIEQLSKQKLELNKQYLSLSDYINSLQSTIMQLQSQILSLQKLKGEYENLKQELEKLEKQKADYEEKVKNYQPVHEEYNRVKDQLKKLEDYHNRYLKVSRVSENEIEDLEREIAEKEKQKAEDTEKLSQILKEFELPNDNKKLLEIEKQIENKITEIQNLKRKLEDVKARLAVLQNEKLRKTALENELKNVEEEISTIKFDVAYYQKLKEEVEKMNDEYNRLSVEMGKLEGEIKALQSTIDNDLKELEEIKKKVEKEKKLTDAKKNLEGLREILSEKKLQAFIKNNAKTSIENNLITILSKFDLTYRALELNFEQGGKGKNKASAIVVYNDKGDEVPVNALSGGERTSIAIALRLAIAKSLMKDSGVLIMDEPTVNLDEYRRRELIDIIRSSLEIVHQIILVTHEEELMEAGDYVLKLEKKGGISKVEVVSNDQQVV